MRHPLIHLSAAAVAAAASAASGQVLAQYSFETEAPTADPLAADFVAPLVSASDIALFRDLVLNPPGNAAGVATDGDEALAIVYGSIEPEDNNAAVPDEVPDEDYLEFTLSPAGPATYDAFTFDAAGQGTGLAQGFFQVQYDAGGGFVDAGPIQSTSLVNEYESFSYDLSAIPASASPVTFRLAIADGGGANPTNTLEIDNVVVAGTVVPEPAATGLLLTAGLGLLARRRRG